MRIIQRNEISKTPDIFVDNIHYVIFVGLLLVPIFGYGFAETIEVTIPSGSSKPTAPSHFLPEEVSLRPGDKIHWGNADTEVHTVTSGSLLSGPTGLFDSGHLEPGDKFEVVFLEESLGEMEYFCTIHPWMTGIVNVIDLEPDFQIYHNAGSEVSNSPIDIAYKVQRNLVNVEIDLPRNMLVFNFAGKIANDKFVVRLPDELIQNPQAVWRGDVQITDFELKEQNGLKTLTVPLNENTQQVKVIGTKVIGKLMEKEVVLINQILAVTDKKFYEEGDEIIVSGEIQNPVQLLQISLDVTSPQGFGAYHKEIQIGNQTKFTETIPTTGVLRGFGEYQIKISGSSAKTSFMTFEYGIGPKIYKSPYTQMKLGTKPSEVMCNEGFELLRKVSNGDAVCLSQSTAKILVEREWANYF